MPEIWKDIKGYEGLYQVSDYGRVKSFCGYPSTRTLILKQNIGNHGYLCVSLYKNKAIKRVCVHRIVAEEFINNSKKSPCVNHKDGNKLNNRLSNLEWVTYQENTKHAFKIGLIERPSGVDHWKTGLIGKKCKVSKPVLQYSLDGKFIKEFDSTMDVQRDIGVHNTSVSKVALGKRFQANGFIWKYKNTSS